MFHFIIDVKLLYLIIITNYFLLLKIKKFKANLRFILFLLFVLIHGIIAYSYIGISPNYLISQIAGIVIIGTYYYNFIPLYSKDEIIKVYITMCLWVALLGFLFFLLNLNINDDRLQSIFKEPAHYAIVIVPACYFLLTTKKYLRFAVLFLSLVLSQSSIGYMGCAMMLVFSNISTKRMKYILITIPILITTFFYVYNNFYFLKLRVDDSYETLTAVQNGKFKPQTNQSSYALLSNTYITNKNFQDHPFGSGLGSHYHMHTEVYLKLLRPPPYLITLKLEKTNAADAASLSLRLISELGIFGIILIIYLLFLCVKSFNSNKFYFAQGIAIYLLLKLLRDGHYFPPELYFFIWMIYYILNDKYCTKKPEVKQIPAS